MSHENPTFKQYLECEVVRKRNELNMVAAEVSGDIRPKKLKDKIKGALWHLNPQRGVHPATEPFWAAVEGFEQTAKDLELMGEVDNLDFVNYSGMGNPPRASVLRGEINGTNVEVVSLYDNTFMGGYFYQGEGLEAAGFTEPNNAYNFARKYTSVLAQKRRWEDLTFSLKK